MLKFWSFSLLSLSWMQITLIMLYAYHFCACRSMSVSCWLLCFFIISSINIDKFLHIVLIVGTKFHLFYLHISFKNWSVWTGRVNLIVWVANVKNGATDNIRPIVQIHSVYTKLLHLNKTFAFVCRCYCSYVVTCTAIHKHRLSKTRNERSSDGRVKKITTCGTTGVMK